MCLCMPTDDTETYYAVVQPDNLGTSPASVDDPFAYIGSDPAIACDRETAEDLRDRVLDFMNIAPDTPEADRFAIYEMTLTPTDHSTA